MDPRLLLDDALEISIVGSFSRLGYLARRRLFRWRDPAPEALAGRNVLITGPTSGLGRAATDVLAALGPRLILVGRDEARLRHLRDELAGRHGEERFATVVADMSSLASVREAVAQVEASESRLDVIVDNAGAIHRQRTLSPDGIEATFATMVMGPFVLVSGLLPLLRRTGGGRVVSVTSGGMYGQALDLEDLEGASTPYDGTRAYARAKRAQTMLVREWARRLRDTPDRPRVDAMHPGWADTPGLAESLPAFHRIMRPLLRSPAEGADTIVWLATTAGRGEGGRLFLDRRARPFDRIPFTRLGAADRRRLWDLVVAHTGDLDPLPEPAGPLSG
ncbi:hypothetical protein BH24CHL9_BH24CHL9_05190 [soil metagenome]